VDTRLYRLDCRLLLRPVWYEEPPEIIVTFNNNIVYAGMLTTELLLTIDEQLPADTYNLTVEFVNKKDSDSLNGHDKAVIIDSIILNNIVDPKFVWAGIYQPNYPELWAQEQQARGVVLKPQLNNLNYLGWNGKWTLTFDVPVFTWIHKTQNLGWIYD